MITLRTVTPEEYRKNLGMELKDRGLVKAVEERCETINDVCSCMRYADHMYIIELLNEITDLIKQHCEES